LSQGKILNDQINGDEDEDDIHSINYNEDVIHRWGRDIS